MMMLNMNFNHPYLSASTGLVRALLRDCQVTVAKVMDRAIRMAAAGFNRGDRPGLPQVQADK